MPITPCDITLDPSGRQLDGLGTFLFPCAGYLTRVLGGVAGGVPWHWHEEVEVLVVTAGVLRLELPDDRLTIRTGEGCFINAGVAHALTNAQAGECTLKSLVFDASLVGGDERGAINARYVKPLTDCAALSAVHLNGDAPFHAQAISGILNAYDAFEGESFGFELAVREHLSDAWRLVALNHRAQLAGGDHAPSLSGARIKAMLGLIHERYAEPIALGDIARAASVSERECLRSFERATGTTPIQYLMRYRIARAAELLSATDASVTEVSAQTGFAAPSHFAHTFKKLVDMTPSQYRRTYGG